MGEELLALCADPPTVHVAAGESVVEQGVPAPAMYVLASGSMVMVRDGLEFAAVSYPGAVFGEMSGRLPTHASAGRPATGTA